MEGAELRTREHYDGFYAIFVYCDDPSHPEKPRSHVRTLFEVTDGMSLDDHSRWNVLLPATRRPGSAGASTALPLRGNRLPNMGDRAIDPTTGLLADGSDRARQWLICRKCKTRPVPVRAEKLDRVLDGIKDAGLHAVPLRVVAASLARLR